MFAVCQPCALSRDAGELIFTLFIGGCFVNCEEIEIFPQSEKILQPVLGLVGILLLKYHIVFRGANEPF